MFARTIPVHLTRILNERIYMAADQFELQNSECGGIKGIATLINGDVNMKSLKKNLFAFIR